MIDLLDTVDGLVPGPLNFAAVIAIVLLAVWVIWLNVDEPERQPWDDES